MKRLSWLLVIPVIFGLTLFTGCEDPLATDEDITITPGNNVDTVEIGVAETFTFSVIAEAKIQSIEVLRDNRAVDGTLKEDGFTNNTSDNYSFTFTAEEADAGTTISFSLMVVDNKDNEDFEDFSVYVKPLETSLGYEKTGSILGNRIGPDESAWNLVTNVREGGSATSDMQNPSISTGTAADQWIKGWDAETSTRFVKANSYDYANATLESAESAYNAGTAQEQVRDVAADDIYIAKIRGGSEYAVIKITSVDDDISGANTEEIVFTYKKTSENAGS